MPTLAEAAVAAGLKDHELLKVVKPGLSSEEAVADLRGRYPAAFGGRKQFKDMDRKEQDAFEVKHMGKTTRPWWQK